MSLPSLSQRAGSVSAVVLIAAAAFAYFAQLGALTPYAAPDEVLIGLMVHSIRTSGHDLNGRFLPLFFEVPPVSWYQPMAVYAEAALQLIRPFGIATLRAPAVLIGLINGVLLWQLLARVTGSSLTGVCGALILLSAPAHFIHSRLALDYIYPLPFLLAWLYCLARFEQSRRRWWLTGAVAALSVGLFSYASAMLLMPATLLLTLALALTTDNFRRLLVAAAPVALPAALLAAWLATHPEMFADSVSRYSVYDAQLTPLQGAREFFSYPNLARKVSLYWSYLNPAFIFMDAAAPPLFSVRGWGMVLPAVLPLFVIGVWQSRQASPLIRAALFGGLLLAAAPAVMVDEPDAAQRILPLLPFLAAFAALGVRWLSHWHPSASWLASLRTSAIAAAAGGVAYGVYVFVTEGRLSGSALPILAFVAITAVTLRSPARFQPGRALAAILLLAVVVQFVQFQRDYRADYPVRFRDLMAGDLPRALTMVIDRSPPHAGQIYLNGYVDMIREYWRFTAIAASRSDLINKAIYFESTNLSVEQLPAGSLIVARADDDAVHRAYETGSLEVIEAIQERNGRIALTVYRRR